MSLTRRQIDEHSHIFTRWWSLRAEYARPVASSADVTKSCLLARMLMGKDPLPDPPPTWHSSPWYELIEDGEAVINVHFVTRLGEGLTAAWVIAGCSDWRERQVIIEEQSYVLRRVHRHTGLEMDEEWRISRQSKNLWKLERL